MSPARYAPSRPAAVLLDMDGTLVDSEKVWDVSLDQLAVHLGGELTPPLRASLTGSSIGGTIATLHAAFGVDPAVSEAASTAYLLDRTETLFRTDIEWRPGAKSLLAELRSASIPTALVTSTARRLTEIVLDAIGRQWFDATVCGDEVVHPKPHPDPYRRAAELLAVTAADCVAIEDSDIGTTSAAAAGCAVLTVPCDTPVPSGPGRTFAPSLLGIGLAELKALYGRHVALRVSSQ